VVVGDQGAQDRLAGLVVVPDGGGQGQQSLQHPDGDALNGPPAVAFQVELAREVSLTDSMSCRSSSPGQVTVVQDADTRVLVHCVDTVLVVRNLRSGPPVMSNARAARANRSRPIPS
jgi:hypothetical protein